MITEQMQDFMDEVKMNKEYNWFNSKQPLPKLPNMENILSVSMIQDEGEDINYILSDGSTCTKDEYESNNKYINCKDVFQELIELEREERNEEDFDEDEVYDNLENLLWESNPYCEGSILQKEYVTTDDSVYECKPGHLKFVLREFQISEGVNLDKPIVVFANDGGDYGRPEVDRIMVDDNCYVKITGSIDFKLYVYLRDIPKDGKVNIITQLSTCLDD